MAKASVQEQEEKEYKQNKKGITSKHREVRIDPVPTRMENKTISKEEFKKRREKERLANKAADAARAKVLADAGMTREEGNTADELDETQELVDSLKEKIQKVNEKIGAETDAKKSAGLKKKLEKLQQELEEAEEKLEKLETE